jgi:molecular chaperone GrpE
MSDADSRPDDAEQTQRTDAAGDAPADRAGTAGTGGTEGTQPEDHSVRLTHGQFEELKTLARERDDYLKRLQRAVADYQNLQKRVEKLRRAARESIIRSLGEEILPVADSLSLALDATRQTEGGQTFVEGFELVEKAFYAALARLGITPVDAVGQPFDPHFHEALMIEPSEEAEPNTVLREMKRGFVMGDIVLRPSQVIVAGPPMAPAADAEAEGGG